MNNCSVKDDSNNGEVRSTNCTQRTAIANRFYKSEMVVKMENLTSVYNTEEKSLICHKTKISTV